MNSRLPRFEFDNANADPGPTIGLNDNAEVTLWMTRSSQHVPIFAEALTDLAQQSADNHDDERNVAVQTVNERAEAEKTLQIHLNGLRAAVVYLRTRADLGKGETPLELTGKTLNDVRGWLKNAMGDASEPERQQRAQEAFSALSSQMKGMQSILDWWNLSPTETTHED